MAWVRVRDRVTGQQSTKSEGVAKMLRDKYEILSEGKEEGLVEGSKASDETVSVPNATAAPAESVEVAANETVNTTVELEAARKRYEELYGGKPHGRTRLETLVKLIKEKENAG